MTALSFCLGAAQFGTHCSFIVEVGKAGVRVEGAGVQNGLGGLLDFGPLLVGGGGPGKVIVNNVF